VTIALIAGLMLPFVFFWAMGMKSYLDVARELKKSTPNAPIFFSFEVFSYAFNEMKGSRATRGLYVGFGGVLLMPLVLTIVSAVLRKH
jgi:hypothetical protein